MVKRLLTSFAVYGLGVASAVLALAALQYTSSRPAVLISPAVALVTGDAISASGSRCPVLAAAEAPRTCPSSGLSAVRGCPYLEAVAAKAVCPYLEHSADPVCPFLAAHPELRAGATDGCPGRGRGLAPLPADPPATTTGAVTAELGSAPRRAPGTDPI